MNDCGEWAAWLRLTLIPEVGNAARRALLKACGSPQAVFKASLQALSAIIEPPLAERLLRHECQADIDAALEWADQHAVHVGQRGRPDSEVLQVADQDVGGVELGGHQASVLAWCMSSVVGGLLRTDPPPAPASSRSTACMR